VSNALDEGPSHKQRFKASNYRSIYIFHNDFLVCQMRPEVSKSYIAVYMLNHLT